jgi:conserved oligomeric Golgi complex subunit 5
LQSIPIPFTVQLNKGTLHIHSSLMLSPNPVFSPETVFVLRSLSNFESLYLSRSSNKINELIGQALAGGNRAPPSATEGINIARVVTNELDSARFDPLLVKSVARNAVKSLDMLISRIDSLVQLFLPHDLAVSYTEQVTRDRSATNFSGTVATPQLVVNAHLTTCLYQCGSRLDKLKGDHTDATLETLSLVIEVHTVCAINTKKLILGLAYSESV